jgi:glycosyltransferase involved in cell wall biosynthesis
MENPLVTVYITNYNYKQYLNQSIKSVLEQSIQDFELIIIDDGSTDGSKSIIEKYRGNEKISIIYQQNKGLNITNNIAMRTAKGKYLMRLDADDFLEFDALEAMSSILEEDDKLGLVFPDYYYVDKNGAVTGEERRHNFEKEVSLFDQPAHGACTMIRLSFLKDIGGYNESFSCQDGYDLWLKFVINYSVTNINRPLFSYRKHGENLTSNENRILETRRAIKETFLQKNKTEYSSLIVIPVRNNKIKNESWPLANSGNTSVLSKKVNDCLKTNCCAEIVIVSSDEEIINYAKNEFNFEEKVKVLKRPSRFAAPNETLDATVELAVRDAESRKINFSYVMTATIDYPFTKTSIIDDALNTLLLFKADAVLSVRPDNQMYYKHTGRSLSPILDQEKFTRIERDALYKAAGGITVSTVENFKRNHKINSGIISHIVVDEESAFQINSNFSLKLFKLINKGRIIS